MRSYEIIKHAHRVICLVLHANRQLTFGLFFTVERLLVKVAALGLGADGGLGTGFDILSSGVCGVDTLSSGVCGLDTGDA